MRILYLIPKYPTLSETFVSSEITNLRRLGHDVVVVSFVRPTAQELAAMPESLRHAASVTVYLSGVTLGAAAAAGIVSSKWWTRRVRALNRQVSAAATHRGNPLMRLVRAAAAAKVARQCKADHVHAHWPSASQVGTLVQSMTSLSFSVSVHAHEVAHDYGHFPVTLKYVRFASFCNAAAMKHLLQRLDCPASIVSRCHLVYHGVDLEEFVVHPPPDLEVGGRLRIVSAGRLTPTKGFHRLIAAVIASRAAGRSVELIILGEGSQRHVLQQLASRGGVEDLVSFRGWVSPEEMRQQLRAAHLFALLADDTFHDGLPNVVLEAMATGRPVLLSSLPAATEVIRHEHNGWIVPVEMPSEKVAEMWKLIAERPARLTQMGMRAREEVERAHDKRRHVQRLSELFIEAEQQR